MRLFLLLFMVALCHSQALRGCPQNSRCIDRFQCNTYKDLLASSTRAQLVAFLRANLCRFANRQIHICCEERTRSVPSTPPTTPPTTPPSTTTRAGIPIPVRSTVLPRVCGNPTIADKIIEGEVTVRGEAPWMASLGYNRRTGLSFQCGGSIIHQRYVLTAAHCLTSRPIVVRLGEWDFRTNPDCEENGLGRDCSPGHIDAGIDRIIMHPTHGTRYYESDDIALIRLNITLDFNSPQLRHIQPVCLPRPDFNPKVRAQSVDPQVMGWGITETDDPSEVLLKASTRVVNDSVCLDLLGRRSIQYGDKQICTLARTRTGSCGGDSGGPLTLPSSGGPPIQQIGIVSYGPDPCENQDTPSVYTSVIEYVDWITQNIEP